MINCYKPAEGIPMRTHNTILGALLQTYLAAAKIKGIRAYESR